MMIGIDIDNMTDTDLIEFANNKVDGSVPKFKLKFCWSRKSLFAFKTINVRIKIRQNSFTY